MTPDMPSNSRPWVKKGITIMLFIYTFASGLLTLYVSETDTYTIEWLGFTGSTKTALYVLTLVLFIAAFKSQSQD